MAEHNQVVLPMARERVDPQAQEACAERIRPPLLIRGRLPEIVEDAHGADGRDPQLTHPQAVHGRHARRGGVYAQLCGQPSAQLLPPGGPCVRVHLVLADRQGYARERRTQRVVGELPEHGPPVAHRPVCPEPTLVHNAFHIEESLFVH